MLFNRVKGKSDQEITAMMNEARVDARNAQASSSSSSSSNT
jgi:hypothetical protein